MRFFIYSTFNKIKKELVTITNLVLRVSIVISLVSLDYKQLFII